MNCKIIKGFCKLEIDGDIKKLTLEQSIVFKVDFLQESQ